MLSVKGIYDGNIIIPLAKIDKKKNTVVIITFLEEESIPSEIDIIKDVRERYHRLSETFDFGETPDDEYAKELMSVYNEIFPRN